MSSISVITTILLLFIFVHGLTIALKNTSKHKLNTYFTDRQYGFNILHDCLYYSVTDDSLDYEPGWSGLSQIIPFCIRPDGDEILDSVPSTMNGTIYTFSELRLQQITSQQLYDWSAPVDLAQRYQFYLNSSNELLSNETFSNCTRPWFGQFCQFRFDEDESLSNIIKVSFFSKNEQLGNMFQVTNSTCYVHLNCDTGPEPYCLDWRAICDGKTDCINDNADERYCSELEMKICDIDEFQCHNGQCIPEEFFRNDRANPDCMDGSDEWGRYVCSEDPSMRCEDRSSAHGYLPDKRGAIFNCGTGESSFLYEDLCSNNRLFLFYRNVFSSSNNYLLSNECWSALVHYFKVNSYVNLTINESSLCYSAKEHCSRFIFDSCPSLFIFPSSPALFGHVYLNYFRNQSVDQSLSPKNLAQLIYVCYNNRLCPYMLYTIKINGSNCQLVTVFWSCSSNGISEELCKNDGFFRCENSNGVADCLNSEDEKADEKLIKNEPDSFTKICDSFVDINFESYIENRSAETDETNCEKWPCSNVYTHCNGYWNCKNGSDELNCPNLPSTCRANEFQCVSSETFALICLPAVRAGDGHVDCLGGSNERLYCRRDAPDDLTVRYRCWNSNRCIDVYNICSDIKECRFKDEKKFCNTTYGMFGICDQYDWHPEKERHPSHQFLCDMDESLKINTMYFALTDQGHRPNVPKTNWLENNVLLPPFHNYKSRSVIVAWLCNRGLFVWRWIGKELRHFCLCPPAYYSHRCQFQNQRISLSYRVHTTEWRTVFIFVIMLIDNSSQIHSYEQRSYLALRDCDVLFGINLLYSSRPKDLSKKYIVRIDLFEKFNLNYRVTWEFPIEFYFLPVYRISTILKVPSEMSTTSNDCFPNCIHGECLLYVNTQRPFCRCIQGWFGLSCERNYSCYCANGSICIGSDNHNTICVCSLDKYGGRCLLTRSPCNPNPCMNEGLCVPTDERISIHNFLCICRQSYTGLTCEHEHSRIEISFPDMPIPTSVIIHMITVLNNASHLRTTVIKKLAFDQDYVTIYQSLEYHVIFVQLHGSYFLAYIEPKFKPASILNLPLAVSNECRFVNMLLNSTVMSLNILERTKFYYDLCHEQSHLECFYDEIHMCLCLSERHANCLEFDHNMTYDCYEMNNCKNDAQCLQDHPTCPSSRSCVCAECYYGSQCQFNTKGFGLTLDVILGYQIRPHLSLRRQPMTLQMVMVVTTIMFMLGLVNGFASIMTFKSANVRHVGCGLYLLFSSILSTCTTITFNFKFWFLVLAQKGTITNRSYISFSCIVVDMLLQVSINSSEWLNAVAIVERAFIVNKGVPLDKKKTKHFATIFIPVLIAFISLTNIHDPLHRHLIDDIEEQRTWCIVSYSNSIQILNSVTKIFHFLTPFLLNVSSALIIILTISRKHAKVKQQIVYTQHFREQFRQHRHLLVSPIILIVLTLPRLIISVKFGCMKSARNPWIFLVGYYSSYIPSLLTFIVFVLPSDMYKTEFFDALKQQRMVIKRLLTGVP
ncbi:hypothetical protein I4U23_027519 [Adineta vaga]|nr:hypothetical protein I4U23_027519 [Adineta vaga]